MSNNKKDLLFDFLVIVIE